ncbi:hypothetical protein P9112_002096 [Eukaryota sp. TZLM1-RC]
MTDISKIYLGNLPLNYSRDELQSKLDDFGGNVIVIRTRMPEKSHFAIVSVPSDKLEETKKSLSGGDWIVEDAKPIRPRERHQFRQRRESVPQGEVTEGQERRPSRPARRMPFFLRIHAIRRQRMRENGSSRTVSTENDGTYLFVNNLPFSFDDAKLKEWVDEHKLPITSVKVPVVRYFDRKLQAPAVRPLGRGYIRAESPEKAQEVIAKYDQTEIGGRRVRIALARSGPRVPVEQSKEQ